MSKKSLLSIGMIVKNEIRCLEKCLKALQPLRDAIPCELVIADTGSTDGTREVAEKYADILFDFEWINDFAAARNAVIERCTGKWYLSVDADEYLQPDVSKLVQFFQHPKADEYEFGFVIVRNYRTPDMQGDYESFSALRLAKNSPELRYEGAIHEVFPVTSKSRIVDLTEIVFDHDGYTEVSDDHLMKKARRNIPLLEQAYAEDPEDLHRLLQCLEGCATVPTKREHYMFLAMQKIMDEKRPANWDIKAPPIARKAIEYAWRNDYEEMEEWVLWAKANFPNSLYTQIDINCYYLFFLFSNQRHSESITVGLEYLQGIRRYAQVGPTYIEIQSSPLAVAQKWSENKVRLMTAHAMTQVGQETEALDILEDVDLQAADHDGIIMWLLNLEQMADDPRAMKMMKTQVGHLFTGEDLTAKELEQRQLILNRARQMFGQHSEGHWHLYRWITETYECCAALLETWNRAEAEKLLSRVTDWSEFVTASLARAMMLGADFPDSFYRMKPEYLHALENELAKHYEDTVFYTLRYTEPERVTNWHRLCFAFDLLCAVCMQSNSFESAYADALCDRFEKISGMFLQEYYNPRVIATEDSIDRFPALHRFAWYVVRAVELRKTSNKAGFVHALRGALEQTEAMKFFVQYMMESEKKRQNKELMKAASPELMALAEQVKAILAAYPADDPAVVALKQTPVYQQVAFLIEG